MPDHNTITTTPPSIRDLEVIFAAFQCLKTPPQIDAQKLADMGIYKNASSATSGFGQLRKRIFPRDGTLVLASGALVSVSADGSVASPASAPSTPRKKKKEEWEETRSTPRKRKGGGKATATAAGNDYDGIVDSLVKTERKGEEGEEEEGSGSPAKRQKKTTKRGGEVEYEDDGEGGGGVGGGGAIRTQGRVKAEPMDDEGGDYDDYGEDDVGQV